jgi:EpsI family protein
LGDWKAKEFSLDKAVEKALELDDYILTDYANAKQDKVNFYVAYYDSQRKGRSPHSPQVCMPGGGWVISSLDRIKIDITGKKDFNVNRTIINKDNDKQVVYYWFEQRGRHVANEYLNKWYLLLDSIQRNRSDGALVRITSYVKPYESVEDAEKRIQSFLEVTIPELNKYVPE